MPPRLSWLQVRLHPMQTIYLEEIAAALGVTKSGLIQGICDGDFEVVRKTEPEELTN